MAHLRGCATESVISVAHLLHAPQKWLPHFFLPGPTHISVAHVSRCATETHIFVAHPSPCATEKGGVGCNPAVGYGAHEFSVAHGLQCATESSNLVAHGEIVRHKNPKLSVAHR